MEKIGVALVCGASQGIGKACGYELARNGYQVFFVARRVEILQEVVASCPNSGLEHGLFQCDFQSQDAVEQLCKKLQSMDLQFNVLVNNASGPPAGGFQDVDLKIIMDGLQSHTLAIHQLVNALVPGMKKSGSGRIINIISTSVKSPIANLYTSNLVRASVASQAKTMANELGKHGITVNNILPGFTNTQRLESLLENAAKQQGKTVKEVEVIWKGLAPLGRFAEPEETAYLAAFLASPKAAYITGTSIPVDGGRTQAF